MLIEEMLNKRDLATNICVSIQNQIGKDIAGVFEMDDFEKRTTEEFNDYVFSEMERLNLKVMIFTGWAFTKELFHKQYDYFNENADEIDLLYLPEINTFIIAKDINVLIKNVINKLQKEVINISSLSILNIIISDNGIQIDYCGKSTVKFFEERPKSVEEIIKQEAL